MKVIKANYHDIKKCNFTGIIIHENKDIFCLKNSKVHNKKMPSCIYNDGCFAWWFNNKYYGYTKDFTKRTWQLKVAELKRELKLKMFI